MIFGIATGWRQGNILKLKWADVDLMNRRMWIKAEEFKNRHAFGSPINDATYEVLVRQMGKHFTYVFTYKGEPINQINTKAWRKALKMADIEDFRWHDLRHTFASWLAMQGATMVELQEAGGWKSSSMVGRYAHLSPDHKMKVASKVDPLFCTVP